MCAFNLTLAQYLELEPALRTFPANLTFAQFRKVERACKNLYTLSCRAEAAMPSPNLMVKLASAAVNDIEQWENVRAHVPQITADQYVANIAWANQMQFEALGNWKRIGWFYARQARALCYRAVASLRFREMDLRHTCVRKLQVRFLVLAALSLGSFGFSIATAWQSEQVASIILAGISGCSMSRALWYNMRIVKFIDQGANRLRKNASTLRRAARWHEKAKVDGIV